MPLKFDSQINCAEVLKLLALLTLFLGAWNGKSLAEGKESDSLTVRLRSQTETSAGSGRYHRIEKPEAWNPKETAIIICDMWDSHHCLNAVRRVNEVAPRMNKLVEALRAQGAVVVHAPSGCMNAYADHAARKRAQETKLASNVPSDIGKWCDQIPAEDSIPYPIDQAEGGEDDDLVEHEQWAATLKAAGRNPRAPWLKQTDLIRIHEDKDYISDSGTEIWSILEAQKIQHVMLVGVHTNMCVLGRPFGLRQLSSHGKQVVLVRDMTDTMYDPRKWPYVNHFSGTDLIVSHIERHVCPTITSSDVLGGHEFRFSHDRRPELAILIAEDEYETNVTLPAFAAQHLANYRLQIIHGNDSTLYDLPGVEQIAHADALLVSMRRRPLPTEQLKVIREFIASGKPVIGIRTASHAFSLRNKEPEAGLSAWPEFDAQVLGGSYTNHYANDLFPKISFIPPAADSPALDLQKSLSAVEFQSKGSLYKVSPLGPGTHPLLLGAIEGQTPEPVAWTNVRAGGGRTFYTSLGHKSDFETNEFRLLLANGIHWACGEPLISIKDIEAQRQRYTASKGRQRLATSK